MCRTRSPSFRAPARTVIIRAWSTDKSLACSAVRGGHSSIGPGDAGCDPIAMEETMQSRFVLSMIAGAAVLLLPGASDSGWAQGGPSAAAGAITGQVTSEAEGAMEGGVVTAKKAGAKGSISVVTDAQGRYSFPAERLAPGPDAVSCRAGGSG